MPPRPPVTTLVIHTWKEHGKPRPLSDNRQSTQLVRDQISKSLSNEAHLSALLPHEEEVISAPPHNRPAVTRSTSVDRLLAVKCTVTGGEHIDDVLPSVSEHSALVPKGKPPCRGTGRPAETTVEWPLLHRRHVSNTPAIPPRAKSLLLAEHNTLWGKVTHMRTKSSGAREPINNGLLVGCTIQQSSSLDAGLSRIACRGMNPRM